MITKKRMGLDAPFFLYILGQCLKTHIGVHWLRQEVVASCLKSHFAVAAESIGCKGNDWKVRILRLQYSGSFQTIHLRHLDVHQHKINASLLHLIWHHDVPLSIPPVNLLFFAKPFCEHIPANGENAWGYE